MPRKKKDPSHDEELLTSNPPQKSRKKKVDVSLDVNGEPTGRDAQNPVDDNGEPTGRDAQNPIDDNGEPSERDAQNPIDDNGEPSGRDAQIEQENVERYQQLIERWKTQVQGMSEDELQTVMLGLCRDRTFQYILLYMREYPERLVSDHNTYSDSCVGGEELSRYVGHTDLDAFPYQWLKLHHIPEAEAIQNSLILLHAQMATIIHEAPDIPMIRILRHFALDEIEFDILSTLVMAMSVEAILRMMSVAWADFSVRQPTVSFICELLMRPGRTFSEIYSRFSESGTLRRMRLVITERHAKFPNHTPLAYAPLSVEQCVIDAFTGQSSAPASLSQAPAIPFKNVWLEDETREALLYSLQSPNPRICMTGEPHSGRRTVVIAALLSLKKKRPVEIDLTREFLYAPEHPVREHIAEIMRNALMHGDALMLRLDSLDFNSDLALQIERNASHIAQLCRDFSGTLILLARSPHKIIDAAFNTPLTLHIAPPELNASRRLWRKALAPYCSKEDTDILAHTFSQNYKLPAGQIFNVVRTSAEARRNTGQTLQSHHILNEIRRSFDHDLGTLADITVSDVPLSGVILTQDAKAQVDQILAYANNLHNVLDEWGFRQKSPYGNALSVLFTGVPGTGKTLLACALAHHLGKVLYRVDLSRIVDKYIGETEKNLAKIFDEAAKAQAIILFDEADSLFSKRTDVKSSNDRYANLEVNFLLQKLESYDGMTIMTTNLSKSIDDAFRRRIRFIIDFPMPDEDARAILWQRMMPPNAPVSDDIRWKWLARTFEMSGGHIRNAILKAAIAASAARVPIDMRLLAQAAEDEARSMGTLMRITQDYDIDD